jgi:hypothetical protein
MSEVIRLDKQIFSKNDFEKVVDKSFKQLVKPATETTFTLSDFFELYDNLFLEIPKEGEIESHRFILNRTAEYLGVNINDDIDVQALLDEITSLRTELLDANKTLLDLTKK